MNVLIITANGREHALAQAYAKSKGVKKVVMIPGNGLTDFGNEKVKNYPDVSVNDFDKIVDLCKKEKIDLVDVSQDDIIAHGFIDKFQKLKIPAFGPSKKAAEIEWSKDWARSFMQKYHLPIPQFKSFSNQKNAIEYINSLYRHSGLTRIDSGVANAPQNDELTVFIKASGLAGGKGAIRANTKQEAIAAIDEMKRFGKAGETFLIEECLEGEEFSLFAICDGKNYQIIGTAQDHKTVFNHDEGSNTGGMGCVSPTGVITPSIIRNIEQKILKPFLKGMEQEGRPYLGVLYLGGMSAKHGIKVIEFNARWGDPEAEVIIPSIQTDYVDIVEAVLEKRLNKLKIRFDNKIRISVAGCSMGYPNDYSDVKGKEVFGLDAAMKLPGITIFGAGIERKGNQFFATGGRIFHVVADGETVIQARVRAYGAISMISVKGNNLHYRTDIGWREMERI